MSQKLATQKQQETKKPSMVKQFTHTTINTMFNQPTVILYYDSSYLHATWLLTLMEQISVLCAYEHYQVQIGTIDASEYPEIVASYTHILPTLCLCLSGVPLVYTGMFRVGDVHLWLKAQLQSNCCPVAVYPTPTPTPTQTPTPTMP